MPDAIDYWIILHKPGKHWKPFDGVWYDDPDEADAAAAQCFTPDKRIVSMHRKRLAAIAVED